MTRPPPPKKKKKKVARLCFNICLREAQTLRHFLVYDVVEKTSEYDMHVISFILKISYEKDYPRQV